MFDDRPLYHDDESPHIREIFMGTSGDIKRCGCFSCLTNVNTVCYGQCILHTLTIVGTDENRTSISIQLRLIC